MGLLANRRRIINSVEAQMKNIEMRTAKKLLHQMNHYQRPLAVALIVSLPLLPRLAHGLGSAIPNQDAEAIARGNAFIATADNPAAIYYNPAGISQIEGTEIQFGSHNLWLNSEFETSDRSRHFSAKSEIATVPQLFATHSLKDTPFTLGVGVYAPFGLGVEWSRDTTFSTLALESRLSYITFNPVVAWQILPSLSVAAGPTVNYAKVKLRQGIGISDGDEFSFEGTGWDFGATAGVLWKPHAKWAVGLNYRSPTAINFEGDSRLKPYAAEEDTSANLEFPQSVGFGIAFKPSSRWNVETYVIWTDWDSLNTVTFKKNSGDTPFAFNWESSIMTGVGVTRYLENHWFISAGYFFSEKSMADKTFTPLVPDTDLHVASAGFGYKGEHWRFALAGQLITGAWRNVSGSQGSAISGETADGRYRWFNQSVNFSIGYHF
jgi:long-chain fatty acid transport protein